MPVSLKPNPDKRRNSSGNPEEFRMSLGGHIDELRLRLIRSVIAIAVAWFIGWFLEPPVYTAINGIAMKAVGEYQKVNPNFRYTEAFQTFTGAFMLQFKFSFVIGLGMALPFIATQIWSFVEPGLKPTESKPVKQLIPVSILLFFLGAALCWVILPMTIQWFLTFFAGFTNTQLIQEPGTMVMFLFKMILAFGVGFQLPLLVYIAGRVGIIGADTLTQYWRHATVFVFVISAVLTPSNDPITMLMMAIPLSLLMMLSIAAVRFTTRNVSAGWPEELNSLDG